jgi:hypothetical protein
MHPAASAIIQPIFFTILGTAPSGPAAAHRTDPIEAIRCAAQMIARGYADVVIVDSSEGEKAYSPSEFTQFHSDPEINSGAQEISNRYPASQKKADIPTKVGREAA